MENLNNLPGLNDPSQNKPGREMIEMFLACRNLKNMDVFSLTDPQIKVFMTINGVEQLIGMTEKIQDNLNPNFATTFKIEYRFEVKQPIRFEVIDIDGPNKWELCGHVHTTIGDIVGSKNSTGIFDIKNKNKVNGKLIVRTERVNATETHAAFQLSARKLRNKNGWFSTSSPYFKFTRMTGDAGNVVVYESEAIKKNLNPDWSRFEISVQTLCNGDPHRPVNIEIYTRKRFKEKLMGQCTFTLDEVQNSERREFQLTKPNRTKKYGQLRIGQFDVKEKPSFLEYLKGGVELNVMVAVDFTASNKSAGLHKIYNDGQQNQYQQAIQAVCEILLCYDADKKVPLYGFGARPFGSKDTSHCFSLTGREEDPWCYELSGIMNTYEYALNNVDLNGPTHFAKVMSKAMSVAKENKRDGSNEYQILLILTDGCIHDMEATINCLIDSAYLPLSVIIVGVGNADFTNMDILDGDDGLQNSRGVTAKRDLVQFVPFNKFANNKEALAREVLEEVPAQFIQYMQSQNISPKKSHQVDIKDIVIEKKDTMQEGNMQNILASDEQYAREKNPFAVEN